MDINRYTEEITSMFILDVITMLRRRSSNNIALAAEKWLRQIYLKSLSKIVSHFIFRYSFFIIYFKTFFVRFKFCFNFQGH